MSKKHSITGIVLKRINYGEADKIITVLTREAGKIALIAKGVRKIQSKRKGHLELFSLIRCSYVQSHGMGIITEAESIRQFQNLESSWEKMGYAFHIGEIVDRLFPENEADPRIFVLIERFLKVIDEEQNTARQEEVARLCEQTLLSELGYWDSAVFGSYKKVEKPDIAKDRNVAYIQNIIERELKSIKIFETPAPRILRIDQ